jgi:hypothetical protein
MDDDFVDIRQHVREVLEVCHSLTQQERRPRLLYKNNQSNQPIMYKSNQSTSQHDVQNKPISRSTYAVQTNQSTNLFFVRTTVEWNNERLYQSPKRAKGNNYR